MKQYIRTAVAALTACVSLVSISLGGGVVSANAMSGLQTPRQSFLVNNTDPCTNEGACMCSGKGTTACLHDNGDGNVWTWRKANLSTPGDYVIPVVTTVCSSGAVTSTCPFTAGSGLNTKYHGASIIWLKMNNGKGSCVAGTNPEVAVLRSCGNSVYGDAWVSAASNSYVNVAVTNYWYGVTGTANSYDLCWDGTYGDQAAVTLYASSACQWSLVN